VTAHNLPAAATSFVGRDKELAEIAALLANPDCRLLTLVGPGGIGEAILAATPMGDPRSFARCGK
jgi:hypothetical protein